MILFNLHRQDFSYKLEIAGNTIHEFMEETESKAVQYAKAYVSSWGAGIVLKFESDYGRNL